MSGQAKRVIPKVSGLVRPDNVPMSAIENMPVLSGGNDSVDRAGDAAPQTPVAPSGSGHSTLPIHLIADSPYQNRRIDETHAADLAEIIQTDGLNQPITVRPIQGGRYEIIAGHHRLAAYKLLEKENIPVVIKNVDELGAARSLLFDNIHHKNYTDYEIYKGFKILKEMDRSTTVRSLAKDTGWSKTHVQRILSFEKLPAEAIHLLEENQDLIGAHSATDLAAFCDDGHHQHVIEAMEHIKDGHLTQARVASWIKNRIAPKSRPATREILRDGKTYCSVQLDKNILKISVAKNIDAQILEDAIYEFLAKSALENGGAEEMA